VRREGGMVFIKGGEERRGEERRGDGPIYFIYLFYYDLFVSKIG
jgi:hypothetical protein